MVGTFRPEAVGQEHPLLTLQQQLSREGLRQPLHLARLSSADVEAMVVKMSGVGEAVAPLAGRLYQETEGNPFFLMEIVKALFEMGTVRLEEGAWRGDFAQISEGELPLPAGVSETIQARVRGLNDKTQEALHLAAVLGREFDFDLLDTVWGRGEGATLEALDDLLRHRLIDEGSGAMGRDYAFTHHKIQEVVYARIPRHRRGHAHAQVGAAMERLRSTEVKALAGELAYHFEQGGELDRALTEKAISYLLQAGDRARGLYAHQEAIDYYQQALTLLKEQGEHERAARTLMKLGLTYHTAFDFRRARQAYEEGFALWQRVGGAAANHPVACAPCPQGELARADDAGPGHIPQHFLERCDRSTLQRAGGGEPRDGGLTRPGPDLGGVRRRAQVHLPSARRRTLERRHSSDGGGLCIRLEAGAGSGHRVTECRSVVRHQGSQGLPSERGF
jgi:predicted ATPase